MFKVAIKLKIKRHSVKDVTFISLHREDVTFVSLPV